MISSHDEEVIKLAGQAVPVNGRSVVFDLSVRARALPKANRRIKLESEREPINQPPHFFVLPANSLLEDTQEHIQLVDAIASRDISKAVNILNRHLRPLISPSGEK